MDNHERIASLRVVESGTSSHTDSAHAVRLGHEIQVSAGLLEEYCFAYPCDVGYDLMTLVGAVKYADRAFTRHHGIGWGRQLKVQVPVLDYDRWHDKELIAVLQECLGYLTGDEWRFTFTHRKKKPKPLSSTAPLEHTQRHIFIPYSHGVDSYAQLRLLSKRDKDVVPVCVFTSSTGLEKTWRELCRTKTKGGVKPIPVPVSVPRFRHPEPTFRTRPFLYYSLTAYGALLAKSHRVLIPENGQGSLGGSLVTMGSEAKHRSCHPAFTQRLSNLLEKITDQRIEFDHPELFRTKGEVMAEFAKMESSSSWLIEHSSCSYDQRYSSIDGRQVHCGVCGNCLLRRVSVQSANLFDPTEYLFPDLSQPFIQKSGHPDAKIKAMKAFADIAGNGIRSMQRLADLADSPSHSAIWTEVAAISRAMNEDSNNIHQNMMRMLSTHKHEWFAFLERCGNDSWVSEIARN